MKNFFLNSHRIFIITGIGINHNNNISLVKKLKKILRETKSLNIIFSSNEK